MKSKILIRTLAAGAALLCAALPMQGIPAGADSLSDGSCLKTTDISVSDTEIKMPDSSLSENPPASAYLKNDDDDDDIVHTGKYDYKVNPDGSSITLLGVYIGTDNEETIPDTIDGYSVTDLGSGIFAYQSHAQEIILPESLKTIGSNAFYDCQGLESIHIPEGVTSIGAYAFAGCNHLRSINIPDGVTILKERTFYNCSRLTSITIPESVTSIGSLCFASCGLRNIIIPESVTEIKSMAFTGCTNLSDITIENASCSIYDAEKTIYPQTKIHGKLKSTAHKYADKYNRKFIPTDSIWFLTQPKDAYGAVGEKVTFSVQTSGEVVRYQWQYFDTEQNKWINTGLAGNKTPILTVKCIPSRNNMRYHCIIKDAQGNKLISQPAKLKVIPKITSWPTDVHASVGEKVQFSFKATGAGLKYQWQYYDASQNKWFDSGLPGNKTNTLTVTAYASRNGMAYRCFIRDENNQTLYAGPVVLYID